MRAFEDFAKSVDSGSLSVEGLCVLREGKVVFERRWTPDQDRNIHSNTKSFVSTAVGIAIDDGLISLDDRLVDAFALVHREHPEATLTVAGDGPLEGALRAQVSRLGLDEAVSLPGHVDAGELLRHTDVVAQLSVWENCSYTLLDALVAGAGVVATAVGGNPEILGPAALVPGDAPERDPAAVAAALVSQGTRLDLRPTLDPTWPTVAQMCASVADTYATVCADLPAPGDPDPGRST